MLYYHIGVKILEAQAKEGWGAKVIDQLSKDLKSEFPEMKGFSPQNLKYMRKFAEEYTEELIGQQLVDQLPSIEELEAEIAKDLKINNEK